MTAAALTGAHVARWCRGFSRILPQGEGWRITRSDLRLIGVLLIGSRLLIALALILAWLSDTSRMEEGAVDLFCSWDCNWYVGIADKGYQVPTEISGIGIANWAFFPLLPMLMAGMSQATGLPTVYCGLAIATLATGAGLYGGFLLARDIGGVVFARHASTVLAAWPFAIHTAIPMTEALFVPLTIWSFLLLRRRQWLAAGIAAGLLSATRTTGVLIVLPMIMIAVRDHGLWRLVTIRPGTERAVLALALSGLGLGLYMVHLHWVVGDALAFSHNQAAWQRQFTFPWMTIYDALNPLTITPHWLVANAVCVATGLAGIRLAAVLWRAGLAPEAVFVAATLCVAFASGSANSLPRYAGGLYPAVLAVAILTQSPVARVPAQMFLAAGLFAAAFAWGLEQFYVM